MNQKSNKTNWEASRRLRLGRRISNRWRVLKFFVASLFSLTVLDFAYYFPTSPVLEDFGISLERVTAVDPYLIVASLVSFSILFLAVFRYTTTKERRPLAVVLPVLSAFFFLTVSLLYFHWPLGIVSLLLLISCLTSGGLIISVLLRPIDHGTMRQVLRWIVPAFLVAGGLMIVVYWRTMLSEFYILEQKINPVVVRASFIFPICFAVCSIISCTLLRADSLAWYWKLVRGVIFWGLMLAVFTGFILNQDRPGFVLLANEDDKRTVITLNWRQLRPQWKCKRYSVTSGNRWLVGVPETTSTGGLGLGRFLRVPLHVLLVERFLSL